ncbi:recombination regulator RecX [Bacillus sp. B15-48]|uniref:recombination regulator RecX n=1 Tax=Bacillus sp. B15-48 TaxID=1548601 RepID=UPI00193EF811|nr:recombination regulator RecX [Bacillus sp. B15-48]MBM4765074.1 recombination regulator RecX [Bacillus sp. B15-48]
MPVITKIEVQKRNKERYNIFLDQGKGEEYAFSVDETVLIKYQLKKGIELDDLSITEILYKDDIQKAYHIAIQYLSHRMRSEGEVREHLLKKEKANSVIQEVIHRLTEQKYLNDREFSEAYVRTQINTTDKGPDVIKAELKNKKVEESIIDEALVEFPLEVQIEKIILIANKYVNKNSRDSSRIVKQKLEQQLVRKGYSYDVISIASEEMLTKKNIEEEMEALRYQGNKLYRKFSKLPEFECKQKIKQGLYNKGFSLEQIEEYLNKITIEVEEPF